MGRGVSGQAFFWGGGLETFEAGVGFQGWGREVAGKANDWGVGFSHMHVPGDVAGVGVFFLYSCAVPLITRSLASESRKAAHLPST